MELRLSNLLFLLFKSLCNDIQSFFTSLKFVLQTFSMISFTKWDIQYSWRISNICVNKNSCKISESFEGQERMSIAEMNTSFGAHDLVHMIEDINENASFGAHGLRSLFEEEEPSLDEIKKTFGVFDANNDGFIDASELHGVFCRLGLKERSSCGLEECKKMIKAFDGNGDGLIDFQEFVKFMEICLS